MPSAEDCKSVTKEMGRNDQGGPKDIEVTSSVITIVDNGNNNR